MKSNAKPIPSPAVILARALIICCLLAGFTCGNRASAQTVDSGAPATIAPVVDIVRTPEGMTIQFDGAVSGAYVVQRSTDMVNWTNAGSAQEVSPGHFTFAGALAAPREFYRIQYVSFDPFSPVNPLTTLKVALQNLTLIELALSRMEDSKWQFESLLQKLERDAEKLREISEQDYFAVQADGTIIISWRNDHYFFQNMEEAQELIQSVELEISEALTALETSEERMNDVRNQIEALCDSIAAAEDAKAVLNQARDDARARVDAGNFADDLALEKSVIEAEIAHLKSERLRMEKEKTTLELSQFLALACAEENWQKASTPVNLGGSGNSWSVFWNGHRWDFENEEDARVKQAELNAERDRLMIQGDEYWILAEQIQIDIERVSTDLESIDFEIGMLEFDAQIIADAIAAMQPPIHVNPWDEYWEAYLELIELGEFRALIAAAKRQLEEDYIRLKNVADDLQEMAETPVNRIAYDGFHVVIWGGVVKVFITPGEADAFAGACEAQRQLAAQNAAWYCQKAEELHDWIEFYCEWLDNLDQLIAEARAFLARVRQALNVQPPSPDPFENYQNLAMAEALTKVLRDAKQEEKDNAYWDAWLAQLKADEMRRKGEAGVSLVMPGDGKPTIRVSWGSETMTFDPGQEAEAQAQHQKYLDEREQARAEAELCQLIADLLWDKVQELCDELDVLDEELEDLKEEVAQALSDAIAAIIAPRPDPCAELARALRELQLAITAYGTAESDRADAQAAADRSQAAADAARADAEAGLSLVIGGPRSNGSIVGWGSRRARFPVGQEAAATAQHAAWKAEREQAAIDAALHQSDADTMQARADAAAARRDAAKADIDRLTPEVLRLLVLCVFG